MKEKIKNAIIKIIDYGKKHKILSAIVCLILILKLIGGIKYFYNEIVYGKFEKVAEKVNDYMHSGFITVDDSPSFTHNFFDYSDGFVFFIIPSSDNHNLYNDIVGFDKIDNFSIFYYDTYNSDTPYTQLEIYDTFDKNLLYTKILGIYLYDYAKTPFRNKRAMRAIEGASKMLNPTPILTYTDDSTVYIRGKKKAKSTGYSGWPKVYKIDNDNLLITFDGPYEHCLGRAFRFNHKEEKLYELDITDTPHATGVHTNIIRLNDNKFFIISNGVESGQIGGAGIYKIENEKFVKQDFPPPKNIDKIRLSVNNALMIDEENIIFIGGRLGVLDSAHSTHKCFLYNLKKNKIIKINDFPFYLHDNSEFKTLKTKSGEYFIHFVTFTNHNKIHYFYRYKRQGRST